jgi:hypothetical protein
MLRNDVRKTHDDRRIGAAWRSSLPQSPATGAEPPVDPGTSPHAARTQLTLPAGCMRLPNGEVRTEPKVGIQATTCPQRGQQ